MNSDSKAGLTKIDIVCPSMGKVYAHLAAPKGKHPSENKTEIESAYNSYLK
jgi:hypothetical protein